MITTTSPMPTWMPSSVEQRANCKLDDAMTSVLMSECHGQTSQASIIQSKPKADHHGLLTQTRTARSISATSGSCSGDLALWLLCSWVQLLIDRILDNRLLRRRVGDIHLRILDEHQSTVFEDSVRVPAKLPQVVFVQFKGAKGAPLP